MHILPDLKAFHVLGEQSLFALDQLVLDLLPVLERTESITIDAAVMHEDVFALRINYEPEPLLGVEPLDRSSGHIRPPARIFHAPAMCPVPCWCGSALCPEASKIRWLGPYFNNFFSILPRFYELFTFPTYSHKSA